MKRLMTFVYLFIFIVSLCAIPFLFQNCIKHYDEPLTTYKPVYMSRTDLEKSISLSAPKPFNNPGRIYLRVPYLFVNKPGEGFYVFDNTNPASPQNVAFINAPASYDLVIKNNILYFDNSVDLVVADYDPSSNTLSPITRFRNKFPEPAPPNYNSIPEEFNKASRRGDSVIIGWKK